MRFRGFTLAEAVMTLGVISMIAAITLPSLYTNKAITEYQARLKKTYTELNDFASYFQAEHKMSVSEWTAENGRTVFLESFSEHVVNNKTSDWVSGSSGSNPYKYHTFKGNVIGAPCDASGFRQDITGRIISFDDNPKSGFNGPRICVDINGPKAPNIIGIDVFSFLFTVDGDVIPEGQQHSKSLYDGKGIHWEAGTLLGENNCTQLDYGVTCAYYAINDISPLDSNQKYWSDFIGKKQYKKIK